MTKSNKKVLITGGNKGIGLELVKLFSIKDYAVYVLARDCSKVCIEGVKTINFDLNNISEIPSIKKITGPVDILINNAGIMNSLPMDKYPEEAKERLMNVNLEAPVALINLYIHDMVEKGRGRVVSTASIAGEIGHPDIWYGISKAGIINLTKSIAKTYGPKGVIINCVAPGPTETDMLAVIPEERKEALKKASILNRFTKPEEVAKTIYWLAVESPEYINGTCIDINNGTFLR